MRIEVKTEELTKYGVELAPFKLMDVSAAELICKDINALNIANFNVIHTIDTDGPTHEFVEVLGIHNGLRYKISYYKGKYNVFCTSIHKLKNVDHYDKQLCQEQFIAPSKMGKLSAKKLLVWFQYWELVYNRLVEKNKAQCEEVESDKKKIENLIAENKLKVVIHGNTWYLDNNIMSAKITFTNTRTWVEVKLQDPHKLETLAILAKL